MTDPDLSDHGAEETGKDGGVLREHGFTFDVAFSSVCVEARCPDTWDSARRDGSHGIPVHGNWRLNERHYDALQGPDKAETTEKFSEGELYKALGACIISELETWITVN